jgi:hypothetical protein
MSITSTDHSFTDGVNGRFLSWAYPLGAPGIERYPAEFDDQWRFVRWGSVVYQHITGVASQMALLIEREGTNIVMVVHERNFATGENTVPASLQGNELEGANSTFYLASADFIGPMGIWLPPRTRLMAQTSAGGFQTIAGLFILESQSPERLLPYL